MKKSLFPIAALLLLLANYSCNSNNDETPLTTQQDTLSWTMGMSLAKTVQNDFYTFDNEIILKAFESTLKGEKQPIDDSSYLAACNYIHYLLAQKQYQTAQVKSNNANQRQEKYFAQLTQNNRNLKKSDNGFYYEVLTPGRGVKAQAGQRIKFDFLSINAITGDTIMKTYGNRESIVHVIAPSMFHGMFHGLQLMNAGSKYRFYFPYETCRNVEDLPELTPVIYEIELHEIYKD